MTTWYCYFPPHWVKCKGKYIIRKTIKATIAGLVWYMPRDLLGGDTLPHRKLTALDLDSFPCIAEQMVGWDVVMRPYFVVFPHMNKTVSQEFPLWTTNSHAGSSPASPCPPQPLHVLASYSCPDPSNLLSPLCFLL